MERKREEEGAMNSGRYGHLKSEWNIMASQVNVVMRGCSTHLERYNKPIVYIQQALPRLVFSHSQLFKGFCSKRYTNSHS